MPDLYELLFIMQLIVVISIVFYELYNLMRVSKAYTIMTDFLLFIGFFIPFIIGFMIVMLDTSEYLYHLIFRIEIIFLLLNVLFFVSSLMLKMSYLVKSNKRRRGAYNSFHERGF